MNRPVRSRTALAVGLALLAAASGCEIIASFDRSLIPLDAGDASYQDAPYSDGGTAPDVTSPDAGNPDGGPTPGADGGLDSSVVDSGADANKGDASTVDAADGGGPKDSGGPDSSDSTAPVDTGAPDTGEDSGEDAASDDGG
jgi:hypothetical protein